MYTIDNEIRELTIIEGDIGYIFRFNYDELSSFAWEIQESNQSVYLIPELPVDIEYSTDIDRDFITPAKYSFVAGNYTTEVYYGERKYNLSLSVDSNGSISGVDNESCIISGKANIGNKNINSYQVSLTMDNCSNSLNNGSYTGLMAMNGYEGDRNTLTDKLDLESESIILMIHNERRAIEILALRN